MLMMVMQIGPLQTVKIQDSGGHHLENHKNRDITLMD